MSLAESDPRVRAAPRASAQSGPMVAVTRMRMRHWWDTLLAIRRFRALYRRLDGSEGFLRGTAAPAGPWTIVNVSVWADRNAMLRWSGRVEHVRAVHWTYARVREIWSAESQLSRVSLSASSWDGSLNPGADAASGERDTAPAVASAR